MSNDTILFQHILSNSTCAEWLALTSPITLRYCLKHKIDYQLFMETRDERRGHWEVPRHMLDFMDMASETRVSEIGDVHGTLIRRYANVIYLDADTVIADMETDLREAIILDKIGAVWHATPGLSHYNVGALYASNTGKIRAFVDNWLARAPGKGYEAFPLTWEQGIFNTLGIEQDIINQLDNKWNAGGIAPSENPVVLGFHGWPNVLEAMENAIIVSEI